MMPSVCGDIPRMLNLPLYSQAYMVMLRFLLTGGSASLWKTRTSRNVSAVLSRVWGTPEQLKALIAMVKNA